MDGKRRVEVVVFRDGKMEELVDRVGIGKFELVVECGFVEKEGGEVDVDFVEFVVDEEGEVNGSGRVSVELDVEGDVGIR